MEKTIFALILSSSLFAFAGENNQYLQCARDLCGAELNYTSSRAQGPFGDVVPLEVKAFIENKANPKLEQLAVLSEKLLSFQTKATKNLIGKLADNRLSDEHTFMILVMATTGKLAPVLVDAMESSETGVQYKINIEQALKKIPAQDREVSAQALTALNGLLANDDYARSKIIKDYDFDVMMSELTIYSSIEEVVGRLEASIADIEKSYGPFAFAKDNKTIVKKAKNPKTMSRSEKLDYMRLKSRVYMYNSISATVKKLSHLIRQVDIKKLIRLLDVQPQIDSFNTMLESRSQISAQKNKVFETCHKSINQAFAASPSPLKIRKAKDLIASVKKAAHKAAASYFTDEGLVYAKAAIDYARFLTPPGIGEIEDQLTHSLNLEVKASENLLNKMVAANSAKNKDWQALLAFTLGRFVGSPEDMLWSSTKSFCESLKPPDLQDKAYWSQDVQVSWQSATFPEWGAGIIAHEIGHVVSQVIKNEDLSSEVKLGYEKVATCSTKNHTVLKGREKTFGQPEQYNEEDWADAFAATTLRELNKSWPYSKNYACVLISHDENKAFTNLSLMDLKSTDSHSTGLYRAIQVHLGLEKKLPLSCESVVKPYQKGTFAKSCGR